MGRLGDGFAGESVVRVAGRASGAASVSGRPCRSRYSRSPAVHGHSALACRLGGQARRLSPHRIAIANCRRCLRDRGLRPGAMAQVRRAVHARGRVPYRGAAVARACCPSRAMGRVDLDRHRLHRLIRRALVPALVPLPRARAVPRHAHAGAMGDHRVLRPGDLAGDRRQPVCRGCVSRCSR